MTARETGADMTTGPYGDSPYGHSPYGDMAPGPAAYPLPGQQQPGPQQPAYPQPGYAAQPAYPAAYPQPYYAAPQPRNGMGTAALVLGIIGVALFWTISPPFILGILAVVFGAVGLGRAKRGVASNRGSAVAGLVLGIVAVLAPLAILILSAAIFSTATSPFWGI